MARLLLQTTPPDAELATTRIGGHPLVPGDFTWPRCAQCGNAMQFLAQVRLRDAIETAPDHLVLIFMCHAPREYCECGAPGSGANFATCVRTEGAVLGEPPPGAEQAIGACSGLRIHSTNGSYEETRTTIGPDDFVYGHVGGSVDSVSKFVPECKGCHAPMTFVAQLEQGPDIDTAFDFNGTTACAYACLGCLAEAAVFVDDFY